MGYGDILVSCPMPGQEHLQAERLDVFIESEIGKKVLGQSVENIETLVATGMSEDDAVSIALGPVVVRDEEGNFLRAPAEGAVLTAPAVDSKKKLSWQ